MSRVLDLWAGMTGTVLPFAGSLAPEGWLLCYGQAVSRAVYPHLFDKIGTTFGAGDGSTTFNVPDLRGRVAAGKGDMGGTATNVLTAAKTGAVNAGSALMTGIPSTSNLHVGMRVFSPLFAAGTTIVSIDSSSQVTMSSVATGSANPATVNFGVVNENALGDAGGSRGSVLTSGQMPAHSHNGSTDSAGAHTHTAQGVGTGGTAFATSTGNTPAETTVATSSAGAHTHNVTVSSTGGGEMHSNIQPTIVLNHIIKA